MFNKNLHIDEFTEECKQTLREYICSLCTGVYHQQVLDTCEHIFCRECIVKYINQNKSCSVLKQNTLNEKSLTPMKI
jgi:hypothetical protein